MIKTIAFFMIFFAAPAARAEVLVLEGVMGESSIHPSDLNAGREKFILNGGKPSPGQFDKINYEAVSLGLKALPYVLLTGRYEVATQKLPTGDAGSGATVQDSFLYNAVFAMAEISGALTSSWNLTLGAGAGKTLRYELHQNYSGTHEDIIWSGHPTILRGRVELTYMINSVVGIALEGIYDRVQDSALTAAQDDKATVNNVTIKKGDKFLSGVSADMSGIRYGAGLRLAF